MGKPPDLSHCAEHLRLHDRDRFLLALFIPAAEREAFFTLYTLNTELAHVHQAVSEEMLAHVRYAWWQEGLEAVASGQKPRPHPVLQAITPELAKACLPLAQMYREHFPSMPPQGEQWVDDLSLTMIRTNCPQAEEGWSRARALIARHRAKFGGGGGLWLHLKLMWIGVW